MNRRTLLCMSWGIVSGILLYMMASSNAFSQPTAASDFTIPKPVTPVANPCLRFAAGSIVHQLAALFSMNGELSIQFSYQTTTDSVGRTLFCFMTSSGLENPTLHVKPGDHLLITVTNNTPSTPVNMTIHSPNCGPGGTQMTQSSLNIHFHGTNTSPTCHSDEVIKTLVNSNQTFQYDIAIPADEPPGLYWYHPHVHGLAEAALLGGASGALVVDGIENIQPAVSQLRHRILMFRDQPTTQFQQQGLGEGVGGDPNGIPFQDLTVSNITTNTTTDMSVTPPTTTYTPAVLHMEAGEQQFWRASNSTADTVLDLQVQFDGMPQIIHVVAIDGVPVNSQVGHQPGGLIAMRHFRLPLASRVEFLVNALPANVKLAQLVTLNILTGNDGDDQPNRPILNMQVRAGHEVTESAGDDRVSPFVALNHKQKRFAGLAAAPRTAHRTVFFNEVQPTQFFMDVVGKPEHLFNPNHTPDIVAIQGTVEEWTVENRTQENHEFHFHQLHFLVEALHHFETNGSDPAPGINGQFRDMIEVPHWDGDPAHPFPNVTLRIDFRGHDLGDFVFHCHILGHEDLGMMNIIRVKQHSPSSNATDPTTTLSPVQATTVTKPPNSPKAGDPLAASAQGMVKMN